MNELLPDKIRKDGKTLYTCKNNCGNYISRKNSLCIKCSYAKRGIRKHSELPKGTVVYKSHAYHPCVNNCGNFVRNKGHICLQCSLAKRRRNRKIYTCQICGKPIGHKGSRCRECYLKTATAINKNRRKPYHCKKCGLPVSKQDSYCKTCRDKILLERGEKKQVEINKRNEANEKRLQSKYKKNKFIVCPDNPTGGSHEEIITDNIGVCKWCGRTKDYKKLQAQYLPNIGM